MLLHTALQSVNYSKATRMDVAKPVEFYKTWEMVGMSHLVS